MTHEEELKSLKARLKQLEIDLLGRADRHREKGETLAFRSCDEANQCAANDYSGAVACLAVETALKEVVWDLREAVTGIKYNH